MKTIFAFAFCLAFLLSCENEESESPKTSTQVSAAQEYLSFDGRDDQATGGIKMIPITTPKGEFKVWTKRVGNNPSIKVLLLHGGPGATHELYESFDGFLPQEGIEYIYYDQLGSYYSDQPQDTTLWTIDRFVDEVEQVRIALGLNKDNFFLLGQSWGGILAMEYALKHQEHLKGLIISNMMASAPEYNSYAENVLAKQMDPDVYAKIAKMEDEGDYENPEYMDLLMEHHYTKHLLRKPLADWPESINRTFKHLNPEVYVYMQGPSEFGIKGDATLKDWDIKDRLSEISVPTLVIGAQHDTMDPEHMKWMANEVQNGRLLLAPKGSHLTQYDDQDAFFPGLIDFLKDVDAGDFNP